MFPKNSSVYVYETSRSSSSDAWTFYKEYGEAIDGNFLFTDLKAYIHWEGLQHLLSTDKTKGLLTLLSPRCFPAFDKRVAIYRFYAKDPTTNRMGIKANLVALKDTDPLTSVPNAYLDYMRQEIHKLKEKKLILNEDSIPRSVNKKLYAAVKPLLSKKCNILFLFPSYKENSHKKVQKELTIVRSVLSKIFMKNPTVGDFTEYFETFYDRGHMIYINYKTPFLDYDKKWKKKYKEDYFGHVKQLREYKPGLFSKKAVELNVQKYL